MLQHRTSKSPRIFCIIEDPENFYSSNFETKTRIFSRFNTGVSFRCLPGVTFRSTGDPAPRQTAALLESHSEAVLTDVLTPTAFLEEGDFPRRKLRSQRIVFIRVNGE